jgi:hypothetical protein
MSGYLVPDRLDALADNGIRQAPAFTHWGNRGYEFTMTADNPWGRVTGSGGDCVDALTEVREQLELAG